MSADLPVHSSLDPRLLGQREMVEMVGGTDEDDEPVGKRWSPAGYIAAVADAVEGGIEQPAPACLLGGRRFHGFGGGERRRRGELPFTPSVGPHREQRPQTDDPAADPDPGDGRVKEHPQRDRVASAVVGHEREIQVLLKVEFTPGWRWPAVSWGSCATPAGADRWTGPRS